VVDLLGNERIKSSSSSQLLLVDVTSNGRRVAGKLRVDAGDTFSSAFVASSTATSEEVEREAAKQIFGSARAILERFVCRLDLMGTTLETEGGEFVSFMVLPMQCIVL
jgi:hypothetical protein